MTSDLILRVEYQGQTYDLNVDMDIPLRLDMSTVENGEIGKLFGIGSQTFSLPGLKETNRFFNYAYDVSQDDVPAFYNTIPCSVVYSGETILEGVLQLLDVITDENGYVSYNVEVRDNTVQFNDNIAGKLIKDADWADLEHTLTYANITGSWQDNLLSGSIFYPFAFYGFDNPDQIQLPWPAYSGSGSPGNYLNNSLTPLQASQFLPAVRVKDTLDKIFEQGGFSYTGSFTETSDFNNLYILPKGKETLGIVGEPGEVATCYVAGGLNQTVGTGLSLISMSAEISDPQNAYSTATNSYLIGGTGDYTFAGQISFFNPTAIGGGSVTVTLRLMVGSVGSLSGTVLDSQTASFTSADGFNTFYMSVAATYNATATSDVWIDVTYTINSGTPPNLTLFSSRTFRCTQAPQGTIGSTVNMGAQFGGNTKSIDILNGLIQQFNLVLVPYPYNPKVIQIETFDHWIRSGEIKDWTYRYDTAKRIGINHTVDEQAKQLLLKASNDVDRFSKTTIENDPFYQYGTLRIIADNNISQGEQSIGDFFGPVILGGPIAAESTGVGTPNGDGFLDIDLNLNLVFPHLYKFENSQAKPYVFKPRLGYKVTNPWPYNTYIGATGGAADLLPSGSLYATISNVSALPVVSGSTNDLHYNNTYGLFTNTNNLDEGVTNYTNYWQTYLESLYWEGSKKVTLDLLFEPYEFKTINLNDRILVKNQMYRINKISGFNIAHKDVVRVELLKLYPKYSSGQ